MTNPHENGQDMSARKEARTGVGCVQIEGVPRLTWPKVDWCGYTGVAMVLQYWFGPKYTDTAIYEQFSKEQEAAGKDTNVWPNAQRLIQVVKNLDDIPEIKGAALAGNYYEKHGRDPHDVLRGLIERGIPCIVRTPTHFRVAVGFTDDTYTLFDPGSPYAVQIWKKTVFEEEWAKHDVKYPDNSSHLILAIYPADREVVRQKKEKHVKRSDKFIESVHFPGVPVIYVNSRAAAPKSTQYLE